jgi:hypothetical protein
MRADIVDDGSKPGLRDFDLVFADGHAEPLEVTSATVPSLRAARAAYERYNPMVLQVGGLTRAWHVFSTIATDFKRLDSRSLAPLLQAIEGAGLDRVHFPMDFHHAPTIHPLAAQLGVDAAFAMTGVAGRVLVSGPDDDRVWSSDHNNPGRHVLAAIEENATKKDNRQKLSARVGVDSHLFIWIDEENYPPWRDLLDGSVPNRAPTLPSEITTVWVATRIAGSLVYWVYALSSGWRTGIG